MILIGTSGYSYDDWVGPVYPPGTASKDFLRLYAQQFALTELNFSYYRQPDARTVARMVHATPDTFRFTIKGHKTLTHETGGDLEAESRTFKEGIRPLVEAGRLACVVMQFPYSFHYTTGTRKYLDSVCRQFERLPTAVEFRHVSWAVDSVFAELEKRRVTLVAVDAPSLPRLFPTLDVVTNPDFFYIRFHGRNTAGWRSGTMQKKFDYNYSEEELQEWIERRIEPMTRQSGHGFVFFNNHVGAQAPRNAQTMVRLLRERRLEVG